jgi:hypothetical protein
MLILLALGYYHENPFGGIDELKKAFGQSTPAARV